MSVLKTSPDLKEIIKKAVERIGEDHAKSRDHKYDYNGITLKNEDLVIEEALKEAANEMAEKMVLENAIDGMVKSTIKEIGGGSGFEKAQGESDSLKKYKKRQEVGEQEEFVGEGCTPAQIALGLEPIPGGGCECHPSKKMDESGNCVGKEDEKTKVEESTTNMIKKLVSKKLKEKARLSEDLTRTPVQGRIPGLDVYEKSIKKSKKETDAHFKDTKKKFEDYADFENNSKPEFPHQNNSKTADADGQFQYYRNDDEQEEYIDDNRGMGLQDANGAVDLEKISDYLDGSSTTGNAQVDADGNALGNVTKSDLGKKIEKTAIRKKKKNDDALNSMSNDRRYSPNIQKVKTVKEDVAIDMENMKKLWAYNKKTQ